MRRIVTAVALALALNFSFSSGFTRVHAEEETIVAAREEYSFDNENNALTKLGRGFCNLGTFWLEVPDEMGKVNQESGPLKAGSWGFCKGAGKAFVRMFAGLYEIITFPLPLPSGYKPLLKDPEFFYTDRTW